MSRTRAALGAAACLLLAACATGQLLANGNTNECMHVAWHGYPEDGTPIHVVHCMGKDNQLWTLTKTGQITGIGGSCLDILGSQPVDGAQVIFVSCNGRPSQNWTYSGGQIVGLGGKCVDVRGETPHDWAPLIIAPCNGSPTQQWSFH